MNRIKISENGIAHIILPISFACLIAAVGVFVLFKVNAIAPNVVPLSSSSTVFANNSDNGKTINMYLGQKLEVKLSNSAWVFYNPSNSEVIGLITSNVTKSSNSAPSGSITNIYETYATGSSNISANLTSRPTCNTNTLCPQWVSVSNFDFTVVVKPPNNI